MARLSGNVYVDPAYTAEITGTTHPITGEELEFNVNAFASGGTTSNVPAVGGTIFFNDLDRLGSSIYNDGTYDMVLINTRSNYLYVVPKTANKTYTRDMIVNVEGGTHQHLALLGRSDGVTLVGDLTFTAKNVHFGTANDNMGGGDSNDSNCVILGDITFSITDSTTGGSFYVHCGNVGSAEERSTIKGTVTNFKSTSAFRGIRTGDGRAVYGDFDLAITGSSFNNSLELGYATNNSTWEGNFTMTVTASTATNIYGFERATAVLGENTFTLNVAASETATRTGTIYNFDVVNVKNGANLIVNGMNNTPVLNIELGANFTTQNLETVEVINVIGDLVQPDTVIVSGLTVSTIDAQIFVGEYEYTVGKFPGYYEIIGGDLVLHNATSTVLLVNSNYTNGEKTDLGPKGYATVAAAQAAVTDKASTTIMIYSGDSTVDPSEFTAPIVTKDFSTSLVGEEGNAVSLQGQDVVIGDLGADTASATFSASYTNDINSVTFGNVTGTATVNIDHAGEDETSGISTFDMTTAVIGNAQVSIADSYITDVKLADQADTKGTVTIKNSVIENVYGGAGDVTADLTGANSITNVYAEGNGSKIKLAGSEVETYFAGLSESGAALETLAFNDAITAQTIILGGNANNIGKIEATVTGGAAELLQVGGDGDTVSGDVDLTLAGGKFSTVSIAETSTVAGEINVNLAGGTITAPGDTFYGLIYGASVTGALDGGTEGTKRTLNVLGHAKVDSVANFDELNVTGGTLNVAGGDRKSELSDSNTIEINGDILNERTINAGKISAANINNYGAIGTLRDVTNPDAVGIELTGNLNNYDVVLTSGMEIGGSLVNTGKITAVGDITVGGTFNNSGDLYFYATSTREGVFNQKGGLALNDVDLVNTGFISAGTLTGVKNLTTSKLYVTGGAEISGNITIDAGAEVCFTNKANGEAVALTLGGSITMSDTSSLVVSDVLSTSGTKTITVNVGDLIGVNEIVRSGGKAGEAGGLNDWTIKLQGAKAGMYEYVKTDTSVVIYSLDTLFVNSGFSADSKCVVDGNTLAFGKNAFASVEDAVAAAKSGAKIVVVGDTTGMAVNAAGFDVEINGSIVGDVTAKNVFVTSDSTVNSIASATSLTIDAGALLTVKETISDATAIKIDASEGTGSRLVLDVDPTKVTLDASTVTIIGPAGKTYTARVLAGEGETVPAHAGDLYIISQDNAYYIPASFTAITEEVPAVDGEGNPILDGEGNPTTKTVVTGYTGKFVDGDTFDAATGDAMFANVNAFGSRDEAVAAAKAAGGVFVLVDNVVGNKVGEDGVISLLEVDVARGDDGQTRALVGVHDDGNTPYVSDQDHTTMIVGTTSRGNIYGLSRWFDMSGDYTFIAKDSISTGSNFFITGNQYGSVMNGDVTAVIDGCTFGTTYIGYGNFGTTDFDPIDIDVTINNSRTGQFRGINISGSTAVTINANINISVYDSMIGGAFYGIGTADWVANNANIYQSHFVSGSINVEVGGTTVSNQFRPGDSLPHGANALQTFNVPTTLHVVATEKSAITRADWVMEWDTIIIDADATLQVNHGLEYINAYKDSGSPQDNGGQLIQIYVNMSGYAGGTRSIIVTNPDNGDWEGFINTDATMSNISVIGDNDLTGQRMLVYGTNNPSGSVYHLNRVAVFDKADDMYVNSSFTEATSGTSYQGQDLYYNANAHSNFEGALTYATEWGGAIILTGGTFEAQNFDGNNVELRNGMVGAVTMGDRKESTLKVGKDATFASADGSAKSTMEIATGAKVGDVTNFAAINVAKSAQIEFGAIAGSDISMFADNVIKADSLNFSDATITIDVTKYLGKAHAVISTTGGITGSAANVKLVGTDADKYGIVLTDNDLVVTTTIQSDTYLNSTYTEATTGTILPDGTYLQYGFNAFSDPTAAVANLGSAKNTVTVTGGTFDSDILMNGANFVMDEGSLSGVILGTFEDDYSGMNITINAGSIGGIELTAGDGLYTVSKAAITLGDDVSVTGAIVGAGDTTLTLQGDATIGGIEDVKFITLSTTSLLTAGSIDLNGGTIYVTGAATTGAKEGNLTKIISTDAGITGATYACDPGLTVYASGKDVYLMDLTRIYFNPTYTEAITGTTLSNGDVLQWGSNAFADLTTAMNSVVSGGTLYVSGYTGDVVYNKTTDAISLNLSDGQIGTFRVIGADRNNSKIYHPVTINVDGATLTAGIDYILGRANSYDNVGNSLVYYAPITINLSNGRNNNNLRFVGQWSTIQSGITMTLTNWEIAGDFKPFFGDARAAENENYHSFIDVTFDNVTVPADKWIGLANVTDWGQLDYISLTIKNSTIRTGTGGNGMRIGAFDEGNDGRHNHNTPIIFTVEDSHVNAMLTASNFGNNRTTNYQGTSTLNILGSSNFIKWANWFQVLNMSVDTVLSGGTITFRPGTYEIAPEETVETTGVINIDATGYTGGSKLLINLSTGFQNVEPGSESFLLNLKQDSDKYALVAGTKGLVIWDGVVNNLFYNPTFVDNNAVIGLTGPNGEILVKTVYEDDGETIKILGNAYGEVADYDELVGFEAAKTALAAGNTLYITGGLFGNAENLTPIYGTIAAQDATAFVNLGVTGGTFAGITIAEDGKTVTGDANLELAGGVYGHTFTYEEDREVPVVVDGETTGTEWQTVTLTGWTGGDIIGSKDAVGGVSSLSVTSNVTIRGSVTEFDKMTVSANARVAGDIVVDALEIDCNNSFTVNGALDVGSLHLASADYTGPSKVVLTSDALTTFDQKLISVDGKDDFLVVDNTLWLISEDPGNVYLCSTFDESINGTIYNGDMLFYGINAFSTMETAIARTTTDYTMYVLNGVYDGVYDLSGIGRVNVQIDGGTVGGFIVGDGEDGSRSTVRITANTASVKVGSLAGIEGSTVGYRVIANKNAEIVTIDGIQYLRVGVGTNVSVTDGITYLENGGELVVDLAGYTGGATSVLAPINGIENFIQLVEGETFSRTTVGNQNNGGYVAYYDEAAKALKVAPTGNVIVLDKTNNNSTYYNGQIVEFNGQTTTLVYNYNVSDWNFGGLSQQIPLDGALYVKEGYWFSNFFTQPIRNIFLSGSTIEWMSAGPNEDGSGPTRTGDYVFEAENSRFQGWAYLAGRGTSGTHMGVIVGTVDAETGEVTDGQYNIVLKDTILATGTGDFNVVKYANIKGGTANVTMQNFQIEGDFQLFNYVYDYEGEWLKEVNVTITDAQCPAAKWMGIWDPQGYNQTTVNLYITNANFIGDDNTLGIFGTHPNGDWDGEAHVYISGLTMGGRLSGARGGNGGDNANNILGSRTLHVIGTDNTLRVTREFTTIDIAADAVLKGTTILMPGTTAASAGFILRGEAGYTGDVKEYVIMGDTISGVAQDAAQFLDADGNEIAGYKAIVGNTNVFIYKTAGDVYYSNEFSPQTTGTAITEADGTKNFLVYGDNAVVSMKEAYAAIDNRGGSDNAAIKVMNALTNNLYTNGYRTVVEGGQIANVIGGTNYTTIKVDSGEVDQETGEPIMIDQIVPADPVGTVDITVNKGATVTNVIVASEYSQVLGAATITVGDGTILTGAFDGGKDYVGGTSSLVFQGGASAANIMAFDNVTLNANNVVNLSGAFSGTSITIDASSFADFTKKVLVAEGGFGDTAAITVNVIGTGFGYQFLDDNKTLVITSDLVGNAYANAEWTEADVHNQFVGDMALVWEKNAFNSFAAAAGVVGEGSTLYIEGGTSTDSIALTKKNDVIISANTAGTALGSISADGGTLTIGTDFTAGEVTGFSAIKLNAVDDITVSGITLAEGGTITIDMTGYKQEATDAAVLTVAGGITGLTDENIVLTGEGSGVYHAYYSHLDNSIHAMRIDNFYVDVAFGTAGEGIVEGQTNSITGETLLWGVNAFYSLGEAVGKMANGQGLYINGRPGYNVTTADKLASIYLTNSTVPVLINGFTTGGDTNGSKYYVGDISVTIDASTVGTAAGSFLFGTVTNDEAWNHQNYIYGSATLTVTNSTIGGNPNDANMVTGYNMTHFYGTAEAPALVSMSFKDSTITDDILFIGDSPFGKTNEIVIDGQTQTYVGADVVVTLENVEVPVAKWWRLHGGNQDSEGTFTVNVKNSNFATPTTNMRLAIDDNWGTGWNAIPESHADYIFNFEDVEFNGYLLAGRLDYTREEAELTTFVGAKTLNVAGDVFITNTYWFKEINLTADATFTGSTLRMASAGGKINVDVTGYTGPSKVFINMANAFENVTLNDITVIGLDPEAPAYQIITDFDPEAEAPALTTVVLKGAIKDIYVNSEYVEEDFKLGTSYNGEALFFGENAFDKIDEAIAALTPGATLYVTGGKLRSDAIAADAITVDASAQLTYNGNTVLTIAGDVVNEGTFVISAGGFIDGTTTDILVMTAGSITGEGTFRTDNSGYTVNVVGNEVHLLMKKLDVYVNTAWKDLEAESVVDVPGGTAIIGADAFATADAAAAAVSANGSITILASEVSFANPIVRTVTATEGSTVLKAAVGTGSNVGSLTLQSGAIATEASVRQKGTLTVEAGATVTGGLGMLAGATVLFAEGSFLNIDISAQKVGESASVTNYSILTGTPTITITMAADQADGTYSIATDAAAFASTVTLQTTAATIGELALGSTVQYDGIDYTLALDVETNEVTLTKQVYVAPITVTYANSEWANYADGTVVPVTGGTAIIGYDAFATGDAAIAAVVAYGEVKVLGGEVSFSSTIDKTLTVNAGATLTGKAVFATAVTINGTFAFDTTIATAESAQIEGFSFVSGAATYTLSGTSAVGTYLLASDAAAFASDITFGSYTLKVGETVIVDDTFAYSLAITDGTLALTVAEYVPPVVIPTLAYVNSEWSSKKDGDVVTVGGKSATIGYDAFATLTPAIAAVTDDGAVEVVGGEISFAEGYSKTITVDAGATVIGKATFDSAITINGTIAFNTADATEAAAQFGGFSFVSGTATYTLTAAAVAGTYLLASDAATFNSDVVFGDVTLKVGAEATVIGDFTYALGITDNNDLALTIAAYVPPTPTTYIAKSDVNANGISDVMFQYTGGFGQIGFWLDGTSTWQSTNATHPVDTWEVLGAYDMNANGKADSVLVGNVEVSGIKGAFIGYYVDAQDTDDNWVNISYLTNNEGYVWKNKVGNLTGNEGMNSILWHSTELGALGVWTDGTDNWVSLGAGYDANWEMVGCGDFTGSGKDTVVMSYAGGQVFYTVGIDGAATHLTNSDLGWVVRAIGDFSGDGKDDIVAFHEETGLVAMWGDGSTENWSLVGQLDAADWFVVGAGDYNGDQTDDLLVRQYSTGMLGYYTNGDMSQWNVLGYGVDMNWTVIA